ncbi:bifunctional 3-(3-hydroxy-phenyl)propionate/3-hydroxycinnamic acid hydroxylase [Microtetraspora sp. AC03309]|uniref:bifunctional 3-(3-hydroxy-phenyl)propionate/3-hydroxycinnamic acid hydroxylase n=1 Tax=Microtetraspora sp. AC03309 TaxID=2779376 RepID=UPI001E608D6B|nr:bifunctional 3-(3-hydroxy-phenyl)propionate/3-hydroxycinnamic acid hydroxylase [Microtetraspora sp. AC03309]MCC5577486.1 bifunctional 3-(3-hydroxy-phenyl)propionate/3-hydroxycinnamic acid hydroxylase [Microtetraspora sp. AC03309]
MSDLEIPPVQLDPSDTPEASDVAGTRVDVVIVGAGPVGLTLANILGARGIKVLVVDERAALIDYPRGVGIDDESLRTFQSIGLVAQVQLHTVPNQILRFVNGKGRLLAEIAPGGNDFGWPKRNGFVQPLVDAELLAGLGRHASVETAWQVRMETFEAGREAVTVRLKEHGGAVQDVTARYVVGCDGGRSTTRQLLGTTFDGTTSPTRWVVVDIENDPLGAPNSYVGADPARPFASISIAHGIRRFEFMVMPDEPDEQVESPEFLHGLLAPFVPRPAEASIIRHRVYTHHSRIAGTFRKGRVLLAGDAAHLMPVWQGQGYNSGIRDATNLGWKLAAVVSGLCGEDLLDTYDAERRGHAKAMIDLSTTVGRIISIRNRPLAWLRDRVAGAASLLPSLKRYIVEMRFKPMPRYESGAIVPASGPQSPVGRLFIQPHVQTAGGTALLDDAIGNWFVVLCWNNDPTAILDKDALDMWRRLGARLVAIVPKEQIGRTAFPPEVVVVGDLGPLKSWFDAHTESVVFLRPDRCVAAVSIAQQASDMSRRLARALAASESGRAPVEVGDHG